MENVTLQPLTPTPQTQFPKKTQWVILLLLGIVLIVVSTGYGIRLYSIHPEAFKIRGSAGAGDNFLIGLLGISIGIIISVASILKIIRAQRDVFRQAIFIVILFFAELIFNFGSASILFELVVVVNVIILISLYTINKKAGNKEANRYMIFYGALLSLILGTYYLWDM